MDRFYVRAIKDIQVELYDDIVSYVDALKLQKNILVEELSKVGSFSANQTLSSMGYKIKEG